jgi:hypothetical protein
MNGGGNGIAGDVVRIVAKLFGALFVLAIVLYLLAPAEIKELGSGAVDLFGIGVNFIKGAPLPGQG